MSFEEYSRDFVLPHKGSLMADGHHFAADEFARRCVQEAFGVSDESSVPEDMADIAGQLRQEAYDRALRDVSLVNPIFTEWEKRDFIMLETEEEI